MNTSLPNNDVELHKAFGTILTIDSFSDYILHIARLIYKDELNQQNILEILKIHKIDRIEEIKEELLDLLIVYINLVLEDHIITEKEKHNVALLKRYFKIKEGDFYKFRYDEVEDAIQQQFERMYEDKTISQTEALHSVELQEIFDLSYDQLEELRENEIIKALLKGAEITELDTSKIPDFSKINYNYNKEHHEKQLKDRVWNRDNGLCKQCKIGNNLSVNYIIPLSKGGSKTASNMLLLCDSCKSNK